MKFTHNGTEYEVAELANLARSLSLCSEVKIAPFAQAQLSAAAALIARHEKECAPFSSKPRALASNQRHAAVLSGYRCDDCGEKDVSAGHQTCTKRTALRGEEAPRG